MTDAIIAISAEAQSDIAGRLLDGVLHDAAPSLQTEPA